MRLFWGLALLCAPFFAAVALADDDAAPFIPLYQVMPAAPQPEPQVLAAPQPALRGQPQAQPAARAQQQQGVANSQLIPANLSPPPRAFAPPSPLQVPPGTSCVALTFDDGPDVNLTPRLLAILAQEGVKATFFDIGQRVATWPEIVRAEVAGGNEVGNHTWSHPVLPQLDDDAIRREIARTDAAILAATGVAPKLIRPPYGSISARVRSLDSRPWVLWYTDTLDWRTHSAANTVNVASATPSGTIVLMHDIQPSTINAAEGVIKGLKARGFQFVTVSEMLAGACGAYRDRQVSL